MKLAETTTDPKILDELSKDEDCYVRWRVAQNPNITPETLKQMSIVEMHNEVGLYTSFDGKVQNKVLEPGINYDGFGSIKVFNTRKITVFANNLRPKTEGNTIMKDMDVTVTYSLIPSSIFDFYTNYDMSNHEAKDTGEIQLMSSYISRLITSAVNQSVDKIPALEVNSNLDAIQNNIQQNLNLALENNGLKDKIRIDSVVVVRADLPDSLVESINRVVVAKSAKEEQEVKTQTAKLKAEENQQLASTVTTQSLEYQRLQVLKSAFESGSVKTIIVNGSPLNFLPDSAIK